MAARGRKDVGRESETVMFAAVGHRGLDLEHLERAFESTIVQENVRVKFEDSVHSNKRGGLDA